MSGKFYFAIDRGGTFTDVMCICPNGKIRTLKLLSVDPARYDDAPREGIRRILAEVGGSCEYDVCSFQNLPETFFVVFRKQMIRKLLMVWLKRNTLDGFEWEQLWPQMLC